MTLKERITGSKILREMATLMSGSVVAQFIAFAAYLVLLRIFSPEDFALFNIFFSYIEVLVIASTWKYEMAIVSADDEMESAAVARFALRLNMLVSFILLAVVAVLCFSHALPGNFAQLGTIALLIPPMVFLAGSSRVYTELFNRVRHYRTIAANVTLNALATAVIKAVLGLLGFHRSGMPLGVVASQTVSNLYFRLRLRALHLPPTTRRQCLDAALKYRRMPFFVATKDFVNAFSYNLPFLWLALYVDSAEMGLFALALMVTSRPALMVNGVGERVLYARTAEAVRSKESIWRPIVRYLLVVGAVALPVCGMMAVWGEPILSFLFGSKWEGCGLYVRLLLPWMFLSLGSTPLTFLSIVFSVQNVEFRFFVVLCLLRLAAVAVGVASGRFLLSLTLYATAGALVSVSLLLWYLALMRRYERQLVKG